MKKITRFLQRFSQWSLLLAGVFGAAVTHAQVADGRYNIISRYSGLAMDIAGASHDNGANLQQWALGSGTHQQFDVTNLGNGYYAIRPVHSEKSIDVWGRSTEPGGEIRQYSWGGGNNQQWSIESVDSGYQRIVSRHSGLALDVWGWSMSSGGDIRQWTISTGENQQWEFRPVALGSALPITENFGAVDANSFFSASYKALASNSATSFYYAIAGAGNVSLDSNQLTFSNARFSLGNKTPTVTTSSSDSLGSTTGELNLSQPYRISFCVNGTSGNGSKKFQIYVDNNTAGQANSAHGSASRIYDAAVSSLSGGQRVVINSSVGTATSFLQLRVESEASVTISNLWIEQQSAAQTQPSCASNAPLLSQVGNPVNNQLEGYKSWLSTASTSSARLSADRTRADNIISWQLPHGGFWKHAASVYNNPWNGTAARSGATGVNGVELGTIDNDATVIELLFLADVYQRTGVTSYRDAARNALDFLLVMQYSSGGWPQMYPARTGGGAYSNYVTFNDDAMVRVLLLLDQIDQQVAPLNGNIFSANQRAQVSTAIEQGVVYILNAQIFQDGVRTVWCAQHDPVNYAPRGARSYELPSKSGKESALVVGFLMTRAQTPQIEAAVKAALNWYRNSGVANTRYVKRPSGSTDNNYNPIQSSSGHTMWYRFYDLDRDIGFFSGRLPTDNPPGTGKQYNIMDVEPERRYGYEWGGNYGTNILNYANSVGY